MNKGYFSTGMFLDKIRQNLSLIGVFVFFGLIYGLISLVNHYLFRTASLDLGMNTHALYCFSRFKMNYFSLAIRDSQVIYFADHFSPITMLYVPFYYMFGSYSLLIIQIAGILFGGFGIYQYSKTFLNYKYIPLLLLIHFFSIWGIYSALSFDFHNNVIAAMLVPWLIYHYRKDEKLMFLLYFILILISKENMALWLAFIVLGLIISNFKTKGLRSLVKFEIPLVLFALLYFGFVVGYLMPFLRDGGGHDQLDRYYLLGNSLPEILVTLIKRPFYVLSLLFIEPGGEALFSEIKMELHLMVLISGGWAILVRPSFLIMLIPIYAQKMLTTDSLLWGINNQYSIEFVPIISLAIVTVLEKADNIKLSTIIMWAVLVLTMGATIMTMESRKSKLYNKTNTAFYYNNHYKTDLNIEAINKQIRALPSDAILSVSANLSPHLANREKIYNFPHVRDAEYIVVFTEKRTTYPISKERFEKELNKYYESPDWDIMYNSNSLLILKRK